jgi:integrase
MKYPDVPPHKFADSDEPTLEDFAPRTIGWLIQRFIEETKLPGMKPLGVTHLCALRAIQRRDIGKKRAADLKKQDVIAYCKKRRETIKASTVIQDVCYLSGVLKYAGAAWDDCEDVSDAAIAAARPFLMKNQLIGKSIPRTRRPTDEELERLLDLFAKQNKHPRTEIDMVQLTAFALVSTRRISEICRIEHGGIDWDRKDKDGHPTPMYCVRNLKHPTKKRGNDKWFPLFPELAEIIKRQPRLTSDPRERVFPFNEKSAGARYTLAKRALGIADLRFHDNRREAISRWLRRLPPHEVRLISGHENTLILERNYDARDPADLHKKVKAAEPRPTAV